MVFHYKLQSTFEKDDVDGPLVKCVRFYSFLLFSVRFFFSVFIFIFFPLFIHFPLCPVSWVTYKYRNQKCFSFVSLRVSLASIVVVFRSVISLWLNVIFWKMEMEEFFTTPQWKSAFFKCTDGLGYVKYVIDIVKDLPLLLTIPRSQ